METFSALLAFCEGNPSVTGAFRSQRPVTGSFDVLFDLRLNKRFYKQSRCRWLETPSRSLWRHCNAKAVAWPHGRQHPSGFRRGKPTADQRTWSSLVQLTAWRQGTAWTNKYYVSTQNRQCNVLCSFAWTISWAHSILSGHWNYIQIWLIITRPNITNL